MARAATILDIPHSIGDKVALRHGFDLCVQIRNRTRGHGATTSERCHKLCPPISNALDQLEQRLKLFRLPWVYIRRNLNGKYRVIPLLGDSSDFDYLKYNAEASLKDGVYLHIGQHKPVQLAFLPRRKYDGSISSEWKLSQFWFRSPLLQ